MTVTSDPLADEMRPTIRIAEAEIPRMVDEAIEALADHDANLYQRAGELVTIVSEPGIVDDLDLTHHDTRTGNTIALRPGTPRLRSLAAPTLYERLARVADWERWDAKAKEPRPTSPHGRVASILHTRGDWPRIRPVRGILEAPSLRPNGGVIDAPGYDRATAYVYMPSMAFPEVPARPTQEQAQEALRRLWIEFCADFPFAGLGEAPADWRETDPERHAQYDRARALPDAFVGLAAFLTIIARPAILGAVPGTIFEAATQGSGKTLQIHAFSIGATGRPAGVMTFPAARGEANEEELEKVLSAYAMAGARIVAFDNVKCNVGGPALEKALTSVDTIDLRVLGSSEIRNMPWSAVTIFSGNNLTMNDDVAQRVLVARLESPREDPRSRPARDFLRPDLLASLREKRAQLVVDALTVLRAYVVAPDDAKPSTGTWGSFEAWSRLIPPAIVYAGGPNILDARPKMGSESSDADADAHLTLMRAWPSRERIKTAELLRAIFPDSEADQARGKVPPDGRDELRAAVRCLTRTADGRVPNGTTFGKMISKLRGKIRGGMKIVGQESRTKVREWWVVSLNVPAQEAPPYEAPSNATPEATGEANAEDDADERAAIQEYP